MSHFSSSNKRQKRYYFFLQLICATFTLISAYASAHVKWFITDTGEFSRQTYPLNYLSVLILAAALVFIYFCYWLNRISYQSSLFHHLLYQPLFPHQPTLPNANWPGMGLKIAIATLLIANILHGHFIAPNFDTQGHYQFFIMLQAGLLLILTASQTMFSISLLLTCLLLFFILPLESTIDYFTELIAISIALFFTDPRKRDQVFYLVFPSISYKIKGAEFGLACLRIGLGLQLIILTIHDKLISPAYGLAFLTEYPHVNFLRFINSEFSQDIYFVLCAGMAELCFGILLVSNIAARLALALVIFFFTVSGLALDVNELIGHLPILVAAMILFIYPTQRSWERVETKLELITD